MKTDKDKLLREGSRLAQLEKQFDNPKALEGQSSCSCNC